MKTIKGIVIAILIIICNSFCNAQNTPAHWLAVQKRELKERPYIFEGKVIQQNKGGELTFNVIKITKIYRGSPQLKLGTIKVMSAPGGIDAGPGLKKDSAYIIFGNPSNSTAFQSVATDNLLRIQSNDWISIYGIGASWGLRQVTQYKTVDSLYSFFKANGLMVQEEQKEKK